MLRDLRRFVFLLVALASGVSGFAADPNNQSEPMSVDSLFGMTLIKEVQPLGVSNDGRWLAFTVEDRRLKHLRPGTAGQFEGCRVVIADISSGKLTEITPPGHSAWMPSWSPHNARLAFFADDGTGTSLWVSIAAGQAKRVTSRPFDVLPFGEIRWVMRGSAVVIPISSADPDKSDLGLNRAQTHEKPGVQIRVSPRQTVDALSAPAGSQHQAQAHLMRIDISTGAFMEVTEISVGSGVGAIAPDGNQLVYASHRSDVNRPDAAQYQNYWDLWLTSVNGDHRIRLGDSVPLAYPFSARVSWSPDGRYVAYRSLGLPKERKVVIVPLTDASGTEISPSAECAAATIAHEAPLWNGDSTGVVFTDGDSVRECSAADGRMRTLATIKGYRINQIVKRGYDYAWFPAGKKAIWVLARSMAGGPDAIYEIDMATGAVRTILAEQRVIAGVDTRQICASNDGKTVVFSSESSTDPPDLWSLGNEGAPIRITTLNPALSRIEMGRRELLEWTSSEGVNSHALLLLPAGYISGRRYPMLVWVYSNRTSDLANAFGMTGQEFYNLQMFATRGYVVLYPDVTWRAATVMRGIADQVLPAIDQAVNNGIADPDRIGLIGHSAGSYDAVALLVQTDRFRAAMVSGGGFYDLTSSFAGDMDSTMASDWVMKQMGLGVPPWRAPQLYVENSPAYRLDRVTTPLLMLQGTGDAAWIISQSEYLFSALSFLGKRVEYRRYSGEEHAPDWWNPEDKRDAEIRMLDWFSEYLHGVGSEIGPTETRTSASH